MSKAGFGIRDSGFGITAVLLTLTLSPTCNTQMAPKSDELFARSGEVAGWVKSGETRTFQAANLWEYVDGDAHRYIQAGVERTLTSDYRFQDRVDVVADIHIMKSAEGPRRMLESEWSADAQHAAVGDDARLYATSLVFRKGRYLVRLVAYEEAPEIGKALVELGRAIESKLGSGN